MTTPWPPFIYGTAWKEDLTATLCREAVDAGFRAIDTANQRKHYFEAAVGEAIQASLRRGTVRREDLFLQTKYTYQRGQDDRLPYDPKAPIGEQVRQSFSSSLEHLGVDRIDSLLLHGPELSVGRSAADEGAWRAMESLVDDGRVRYLGVSNVSAAQLELFAARARVPVTFVQNRCYAAQGWDAEVREACGRLGITYQGFSLLTANRRVWEHPRLAALAATRRCTPAQYLFAYVRTLGILPITGTSSAEHMHDDLASLELELTEDETDILWPLSVTRS